MITLEEYKAHLGQRANDMTEEVVVERFETIRIFLTLIFKVWQRERARIPKPTPEE